MHENLITNGFESEQFRRLAVKLGGLLIGVCVACALPTASASITQENQCESSSVECTVNPSASSVCAQNDREHKEQTSEEEAVHVTLEKQEALKCQILALETRPGALRLPHPLPPSLGATKTHLRSLDSDC